jgi:biotin operon repressor
MARDLQVRRPQRRPAPSAPDSPIDEILAFFKALADPTRLRIVGLVAEERRCNQELAAELGLSPATVTHHLRLLKDVGLLQETVERPYVYFELDRGRLQGTLRSAFKRERVQEFAQGPDLPAERRRVLNAFFDGPKLTAIPAQRRKKEIVFEEILRRLPGQEEFTERELSLCLKKIHSDFCTIRREFIMGRYMERKKGIYRLTERGRSVVDG